MPYKGDGKQFSVRMSKEWVEWIDREAKRKHSTRNTIVCQLMEKALQQEGVLEVHEDAAVEYGTHTDKDNPGKDRAM